MSRKPSLTPYRPRTISFIGLAEEEGLTLKTYGITIRGDALGKDLVRSAQRLAFDHVRGTQTEFVAAGIDWTALPSYGVGTLIVHIGRDAIFVLLDVWTGENMLRHHAWAARAAMPVVFESIHPSGIAMCVWEMAVLQHERSAWLRHVLTPSGEGRLDDYLTDTMNITL